MNEEEFDKEIKEKFKQVDAIIQIVSLLEEMLKTFGAKIRRTNHGRNQKHRLYSRERQ